MPLQSSPQQSWCSEDSSGHAWIFSSLTSARESEHIRSSSRAHNAHSQPRELQPGAQVNAKNFGQGPPRLPGVIQESKDPVSNTVELEDARVLRRHVDHLRTHLATTQPSVEKDDYPTTEIYTITEPTLATSWSTTYHSGTESLPFLPATQVTRLLRCDG